MSSRVCARLVVFLTLTICAGAMAQVGGHGAMETVGTGSDAITLVRLEGTRAEMGYWYGYLLADQVAACAAFFDGLFAPQQYAAATAAMWNPDYFDTAAYEAELNGVVAGCAANGHPEITFEKLRRLQLIADMFEAGCGLFALWGNATRDGHLYQLRNLDWEMGTGAQNYPVVAIYSPTDGNRHATIGFAGMISATVGGIGDKGIAVSEIMGGFGDDEGTPPIPFPGIPFGILLRDCIYHDTTLQQALNRINSATRTNEYHYCISGRDPEGNDDARLLFTSNSRFDEFGGGDEVLPHPYYDPIYIPLEDAVYWKRHDGGAYATPGPETVERKGNQTLYAAINARYGNIDAAAAIEIARADGVSDTVVSIVYDTTDLKFWVAYANGPFDPATNQNYVEFNLTPPVAVEDAQVIDFRCIWEYTFDFFGRLGSLMPGWDVGSIDSTQQGGLGIPDAEEFKLLSLILADPAAPNHDAIHDAFTANAALTQATIKGFLVSATTSPYETGPMARQPIPGTDPQQYYAWNAIAAAYITLGEWDEYIDALTTLKNSVFDGPDIVVPTSTEGYVLLPDLLSMCGDADGDGVSNAAEYWAASPHSFANAKDPAITAPGAVWNVWACLDEPQNNARFWYNTSTQRVYFVPAVPLAWNEALDFTIVYPGRADIPVELCTIRNQQENDFVFLVSSSTILNGTLYFSDYPWIGCTDAGRDIGHVAPNPQDWYWLSDPAQSPMAYTNWAANNPDGVDGAQDCGVMTYVRTWQDVSEFKGTPPEPRRLLGIFELDGTYPDSDANGAPDAFEDKNGDSVPDGFEPPRPVAGFTARPLSGDMPLEVRFTDLSDGAGETITAWAWNFGDGATSTQQNPTHIYMAENPASVYDVSLTVTTVNGANTRNKTGYIRVDYACPFDGQLDSQGAVFADAVMAEESICANLKADLVAAGFTDWTDWDIEGLENFPPSAPGDGLPDEIQMALIAYVVCNVRLSPDMGVYAGMTTNKALFLADAAALAGAYPGFPDLAPYADFFAGMIGSSPEMKATVNAMVLSLTGNAEGLPKLDNYVVFGGDAKGIPLFAAYGDFDGDGITNEDEWALVVAAGGGVDAFLMAATDPNNFWPGNPELPAAGLRAAALIAVAMLALATSMRRIIKHK